MTDTTQTMVDAVVAALVAQQGGVTATPGLGNLGDGYVTAAAVGSSPVYGDFVLTAKSATDWSVVDPNGGVLADATTGTPYTSAEIDFTIVAGEDMPFAEGDSFTLSAVETAYPTMAGPRVYAPRDWPSWDRLYPVLFVSAPLERKDGLGRNTAPQFFTTSTVRISGRVSEPAAVNDAAAGAAEAALWTLQRQVEVAVINAISFSAQVQQIPRVTTRLAFSSEGATHLAGITTDLEIEFYQDASDFAPVPGTPIRRLGLVGDLVNVADPSGTYTPAFDYPVNPAPRTEGPDGRAEVRADVPVT